MLGVALGTLGLVGGVPPEAQRSRDPLRVTRTQVEVLRGQRQEAAADLLVDLLAPLSPPADRPAAPEPRPSSIAELERQLAEALARIPDHERALLWGLVQEPELDEGRRSRLLRVLEGGSRDPVDSLEEVLREGQGAPAWEAAVRLGLRGHLGAAPALRRAAAGWRGWGRQYALIGLVLLGDREAVPELRDACRDESPAVRRHAALALGELGTEEDRAFLDLVGRRRPDPVTLRAVLRAKARLYERTQGPS
jgi:HEAT repeat protein